MTKQSGDFDGSPVECLPKNLEQAHLWLQARTPPAGVSPINQQRYHALCAEVYRRVMITDPGHKDWARKWAEAEAQQAEYLGAQIAVRQAFESYLGPDFDVLR